MSEQPTVGRRTVSLTLFVHWNEGKYSDLIIKTSYRKVVLSGLSNQSKDVKRVATKYSILREDPIRTTLTISIFKFEALFLVRATKKMF